MKFTKTTLKELTRQYAIVLKKCAILNMLVLAGSLCATPAMAETINLDEKYPDGVVSGNIVYQAGESAALNTETVDVSGVDESSKVISGAVYVTAGSSIQIGDQGQTDNVTIKGPNNGIVARDRKKPQVPTGAEGASVSITANDTITVSAREMAVFARNNGTGIGPRVDLNAKVVNLEVTGAENDYPAAIWVQNTSQDATEDVATLNITADQINLTATNGSGITAFSQGRVNLIGDTTIKAQTAISTRGDAVVNINKDADHIVKMDGNIDFNYDKDTSGTKIDAIVDVTLSGEESYWNGNTIYSWNGVAPDKSYLEVNSSTLTLKNGATWNASKITDFGDENAGQAYKALNNLNIAKGNVNIADTERGIVVDNVKAQDAVFSGGSLTVLNELSAENSTFKNSVSEKSGGALLNKGTATIVASTFENNTATGQGGAIYNEGTLTFDGNTTFANNTANGVANDIHNTGSLTFNGNTSLTGGVTGDGDIVFNGDELDIGSAVVQGSSISIKDGSTLRANLLSGTAGFDAATLSGDNLNLVVDQGALGGSLVFAQGNADALTLNENNLFDIVVQEGKIVIDRKATDTVVDQFVSTGVMDETTAMGVVTMTEAKGTTPQAQALAAAIVELAQSKDVADQQKAGELAQAAQPTRAPIRQAVTTNTQVMRTASTRMAQLRQGRSGGDLSQAKLSPWVRGLFNKNHNSQGDGFDAYTHGFAVGVDAQVTEDWLIGLGYARTTSTVKEFNRRTHVNGDNYFLYGKYQPAQWYIESTLNYGHNKNKAEAVGLTSNYSVDTYGAQLFSGYQYGIADNYAGIRYTYVKPDDYNNGLNVVNEKNTQVATAVIGTRIAKEFQYSDSVAFEPEFRLAGTYDFKSDNSVANVNVIGGNTLYSVDGRRLHRAALESGVGLTAKYGKMELSADYDIEWRVSNFAQTGMLKLKYNF